MTRTSMWAVLSLGAMVMIACSGSDDGMGGSSGDAEDGGSSSGTSGSSGDTSSSSSSGATSSGATSSGATSSGATSSGATSSGSTSSGGTDAGKDSGQDAGPKACANPPCNTGEACVVPGDCASDHCVANLCVAAACDDTIKNGSETDIDCGGATCGKCAVGKACKVAADCVEGVCGGDGKCAAPTANDGVKNGNETDVDCGSSNVGTNTNAPGCDANKVCKVDGDCKSAGCNWKGVCAWARSCTGQHGGTSCGTGDATDPNNQNGDCCESSDVPSYNLEGYNNASAFRLDKYQITAGRIRKFLTAVNGNVQGWVQANRNKVLAPAQLDSSLDKYLPTGWTQADSADTCTDGTPGNNYPCNYGALNQVSGYRYNNGPGGVGGYACYVGPGNYSTRTYYTTAAENTQVGWGESLMKVPKDRADEKSMTCTTFFIYAAFCAWDGGRLETFEEYNGAYGGDGTNGRIYPWTANNPTQPDPTRPIGFTGYAENTVGPVAARTPYNPPLDANGQWSVFNASLTPALKTELLTRINRANLFWNYANAFMMDYKAPLENRAQTVNPIEANINEANDQSVAVSPPGRYPTGAGRYGHLDLLGNVMEITATASGTSRKWTRNGSFETAHVGNQTLMTGQNYSPFAFLTKYGRAGARCARPAGGYPVNPLP